MFPPPAWQPAHLASNSAATSSACAAGEAASMTAEDARAIQDRGERRCWGRGRRSSVVAATACRRPCMAGRLARAAVRCGRARGAMEEAHGRMGAPVSDSIGGGVVVAGPWIGNGLRQPRGRTEGRWGHTNCIQLKRPGGGTPSGGRWHALCGSCCASLLIGQKHSSRGAILNLQAAALCVCV